MKIRFITLFACLLVCMNIFAQDFNNYTPLRSNGKVPEVLTRSYPDMVDADIAKLAKDDPALYQKKQFTIYTRLIMSRLLMNGRLLINDSLGNYVNKVADRLLANNPGLRKQVHIFVVKSPVVNAYSLDNGILLFNVGLLAQLESESELAYILAHEITHFREHHAMQEFISTTERKTNLTREEQILDKLSFSRENELEADTKGLDLLLKSNYDTRAVITALDVLKYSYLPFDEVAFDNSFFETEDLKLPADLRLEAIKPISNNENYDDTKSTHPNIKTRRDTIEYALRNANDTISGRKKFIVASREQFKRLRTIARFETTRLYLLSQDYPEAIYSSYILQKEYPNSFFLKSIIAKAMYNLTVYRTRYPSEENFSVKRLTLDHEKVEGSSQQVHYLFKELAPSEMAAICLSYCWRLKKENPDDKEVSMMCENLAYMLAKYHKRTASDYKQKIAKTAVAEPDTADPDTGSTELSKYAKIKLDQKKRGVKTSESENESDPFQYAFASLLSDDKEFKTLFSKYLDAERDSIPKPLWMNKETRARLSSSDSIFAVDPIYFRYESKAKLSGRKARIKFNHNKYKEQQKKYETILRETGAQQQIALRFVDPTSFDSLDIELYNDIATLYEWMDENAYHTCPLGLNTRAEDIKKLEGKYGRYWMWNYSVTERRRIKNWGGLLAASVCWPVGIFVVPQLIFHRRYEHTYYTEIIDIRNPSIIVKHEDSARRNLKYSWLRRKMNRSFNTFRTGSD